MSTEELLYRIGEWVESTAKLLVSSTLRFISPRPSKVPPSSRFLTRLFKKAFTPHEILSLRLQLTFLIYLISALVLVFLNLFWVFVVLSVLYLVYLRYLFETYREFVLEYRVYRAFYFWLSFIAIIAYGGYFAVRKYAHSPYHFYFYILVVLVIVLSFRHYFKSRYSRDYTYGVVEEVKNDLVKVFVHDDMAANVKPGYYWVPAVPDAEPGVVVKLLVEERVFRSSRPARILEVYLDTQSSQTETEPKDEAE